MKKSISACLAAAVSLLLLSGIPIAAEEPPPDGNADGLYPNLTVLGDPRPSAAADYLTDIKVDDDQHVIVKTFEVPAGLDEKTLIETDFEKNGYRYHQSYLLKVAEHENQETKLASQTVTVSHDKEDNAAAFLSPLLDYEQDGYTGQLKLDTESIYTEASGSRNYTYAVTDVREYTGLLRNDPYYVPKTVSKNGASLQLQDIQWTEMGDGLFKAEATYAGTGKGSKVTGYVSTAAYIGEVSKKSPGTITYAVVYEGSIIPLPPPNYLMWTLAALAVTGIAAILAVRLLRRKQMKVFARVNGKYEIVGKLRLNYIDPVADLSQYTNFTDFLLLIDRFATKRMNNQHITICLADGTEIDYAVCYNGVPCKLRISAPATANPEEAIA